MKLTAVNSLVPAAVEGGVVLVPVEAKGRDGDRPGAGLLVDAAHDPEARHPLHPTRPDLEDNVMLERREEVDVCRRQHFSNFPDQKNRGNFPGRLF